MPGGRHVPRGRGSAPEIGGRPARARRGGPPRDGLPRDALAPRRATLREFHPYEEPPIEIHDLPPRPSRTAGAGRRIVLDRPVALSELATHAVAPVGDETLRGHGRRSPDRGGGGVRRQRQGTARRGDRQGCTAYITGEMGHHDVLAAQADGCALLLAGHTETERGYLPRLRDRLAAAFPDVEVLVATTDSSPANRRLTRGMCHRLAGSASSRCGLEHALTVPFTRRIDGLRCRASCPRTAGPGTACWTWRRRRRRPGCSMHRRPMAAANRRLPAGSSRRIAIAVCSSIGVEHRDVNR